MPPKLQEVQPIVFGVSVTPSSILQLLAEPGVLLLPQGCGKFNQCPTSCVKARLLDAAPVPILPTYVLKIITPSTAAPPLPATLDGYIEYPAAPLAILLTTQIFKYLFLGQPFSLESSSPMYVCGVLILSIPLVQLPCGSNRANLNSIPTLAAML